MEIKTILKWFLGLITLSSAGFTFLMLVIGIGKIFDGGPKLATNIAVFIFVSALFGFFSFATYKIFSKNRVVSNPQELERKALAFAHLKRGYVSVAELSLHSKISIDEAGQILDELCLKNVARFELSGSGKLIYIFDSFIGEAGEKKDTLEMAIEDAQNAQNTQNTESFLFDEERSKFAKPEVSEEAIQKYEQNQNSNY